MLVDTYRSKIGRGYDVHLPATHIPNEVRCRASMASDEPQICTSAASRRPKRNRSNSPGSPLRRAVGSPLRALMTLSVPVHTRSSPAPRSRRDRNQGIRPTFRKSAASSAGGLVRGPKPFARRTSSWWTKNSLRFPTRRTHSIRKKPCGGPDRMVATRSVNLVSVSPTRRRSANRPQAPGTTSPGPARRSCSRRTR